MFVLILHYWGWGGGRRIPWTHKIVGPEKSEMKNLFPDGCVRGVRLSVLLTLGAINDSINWLRTLQGIHTQV